MEIPDQVIDCFGAGVELKKAGRDSFLCKDAGVPEYDVLWLSVPVCVQDEYPDF